MDKWGFGIVGLGMIAEFHAKAIESLPNARVAGAYSRSFDKASAFADKHGGEAYDDLDALLADPEVNVVTICTPSGFHAEPAIAAAKAGKHVICEKPIDVTLERIDDMIAAHEAAGTTLCGIFPYRYIDVTTVMREAVTAGRFGTLTFGGAYVPWWRDQAYYDDGGWRGTVRFDGGGSLMNQSIHAIDSLLWLMGDVDTVTALTATLAHERIEVEDTAVASVRFKNGALGLIMGTTSIFPGSFRRLEICGNQGTAVCIEEDLVTWQFAEEAPEDAVTRKRFAAMTDTGGGASDPSAISFEGHRRNFESCLAAIEAGEPAPIDGPEARRSVELILAIYESAAKGGQPVKL
jgi:predicted dehydrogenase